MANDPETPRQGNWSALDGKPIWSPPPGPNEPGYSQDLRRDIGDAINPTELASTFNAVDFVVGAVCGLIAIPICDASWQAIVVEPGAMMRGVAGLCVGLPLGLLGLSFHWWKDKRPTFRDWIVKQAANWWIVPLLLAFGYVVGPEMYRRAITRVAVQADTSTEEVSKATEAIRSKLDAANRQLQEEREKAKPLIPPSGVITGLQLTNEVKDLRSQVDELTRQRDAALAGAKAPAPVPSGGPIVWNSPEGQQLFVVGADASGYIVSGALFWGESTEPVSITEAYAISGMTGHKQDLKANVPNKGYFPVDKVDIPPGAPVHLDLAWNPPIPLKDFLNQWGKFHVVVKYNGVKFERDYDEALVRQKLQQQAPDMFGPQITPRDDK